MRIHLALITALAMTSISSSYAEEAALTSCETDYATKISRMHKHHSRREVGQVALVLGGIAATGGTAGVLIAGAAASGATAGIVDGILIGMFGGGGASVLGDVLDREEGIVAASALYKQSKRSYDEVRAQIFDQYVANKMDMVNSQLRRANLPLKTKAEVTSSLTEKEKLKIKAEHSLMDATLFIVNKIRNKKYNPIVELSYDDLQTRIAAKLNDGSLCPLKSIRLGGGDTRPVTYKKALKILAKD